MDSRLSTTLCSASALDTRLLLRYGFRGPLSEIGSGGHIYVLARPVRCGPPVSWHLGSPRSQVLQLFFSTANRQPTNRDAGPAVTCAKTCQCVTGDRMADVGVAAGRVNANISSQVKSMC